MKYYTKEWYHLMQNLNYVTDMKSVPDQEYTEEDIRKDAESLAKYVSHGGPAPASSPEPATYEKKSIDDAYRKLAKDLANNL